MSKFKVGDPVFYIVGNRTLKGKLIDFDPGYKWQWQVELDRPGVWKSIWAEESELELIEEKRTMDNLKAGDVLTCDNHEYDYIVQGVLGESVITVTNNHYRFANLNSVTELKNNGWHLKDTTEPKKMTVSEVAKELGYSVEIVEG